MQGLDQIQKQNRDATRRDIPAQQAAGNYVVVQFVGLNYIGYDVHATEDAAKAAAKEYNERGAGHTSTIYAPIAPHTED